MSADPIEIFKRLFRRAVRAGHPLPEAMALSTADKDGRPSVRYVLLKDADARGFVFYTNALSRKGAELRSNPRASAVFYWHELGKQVRIEGSVEEVTLAEADAYWATRPRESQLSACVSQQSHPIASRELLRRRWTALRKRHHGQSIPRPADWTGFRILADSIEFWTRAPHRLHDRVRFERTRRGWRQSLLQP